MTNITLGQARRIAADWQAPGNGYSTLQHTGFIEEGLEMEIRMDLRSGYTPDDARPELTALQVFVLEHGPGKVEGWGAWDDSPVESVEL